eukprot:3023471-Prymnesium_polylepis.2
MAIAAVDAYLQDLQTKPPEALIASRVIHVQDEGWGTARVDGEGTKLHRLDRAAEALCTHDARVVTWVYYERVETQQLGGCFTVTTHMKVSDNPMHRPLLVIMFECVRTNVDVPPRREQLSCARRVVPDHQPAKQHKAPRHAHRSAGEKAHKLRFCAEHPQFGPFEYG